jgi:hypothetical protein
MMTETTTATGPTAGSRLRRVMAPLSGEARP